MSATATSADRDYLGNREQGGCRDPALRLQARARKQVRKFLLGTLPAVRQHHHRQVDGLARVRRIPWRDYRVDDDNPTILRHRFTASAQDSHADVIGPVLRHTLKDVEIGAAE